MEKNRLDYENYLENRLKRQIRWCSKKMQIVRMWTLVFL
jgi:hypothetical protein